jgi:2-isopropylmalate synthase
MEEVKSKRSFGGYGADTDIIVASAKAYLSAINKLLVASGKFDEVKEEINN